MSGLFIKDVEDNVFNKRLIYRSIFVVNNEEELVAMMEEMDNRNYSVVAIRSVDSSTDYNKIDNRIVMLTHDTFTPFIDNLRHTGNILEASFNLIAFSYDIDYEIVATMMSYYISVTNKNCNGTILFDHHYTQFARLEREIERILM